MTTPRPWLARRTAW
jgi:hypothetical protein